LAESWLSVYADPGTRVPDDVHVKGAGYDGQWKYKKNGVPMASSQMETLNFKVPTEFKKNLRDMR